MPSLVVIGQQIKEKRRGGHNVPPSLTYITTKYPSLNRDKSKTVQVHLPKHSKLMYQNI